MSNLTPKQEAFALAYVETGNASEAYRRAYDPKRMTPEAIAVEASKLLKHPKVALRVSELQAEHAERHKVTVDDIIRQLDEDRLFAREHEAPAAAISSTMGKAKVLGFLTDKVHHSGGNVNVQVVRFSDMTDEELARIAAGG